MPFKQAYLIPLRLRIQPHRRHRRRLLDRQSLCGGRGLPDGKVSMVCPNAAVLRDHLVCVRNDDLFAGVQNHKHHLQCGRPGREHLRDELPDRLHSVQFLVGLHLGEVWNQRTSKLNFKFRLNFYIVQTAMRHPDRRSLGPLASTVTCQQLLPAPCRPVRRRHRPALLHEWRQ